MRLTILIFVLIFSISLRSQNCSTANFKHKMSTKALGKKFQELKTQCVHIGDCNLFGSGLMQLMDTLHARLPIGMTKHKLLKTMGIPDTIATKEAPINHHFDQLKENEIVLIYYWRNMHDFLYFEFKKNRLIHKNWYNAWE